jgi:ATP-dependent exoDNAse (exonuclease V) alpha subunit
MVAFAVIRELNEHNAKLEFSSGRQLTLSLPTLRHVDWGYASTSHAAQGATVDKVINVDSMRSDQLVNHQQFYVSVGRARDDAQVYTEDIQALRNAVTREHHKEFALDPRKLQQSTPQLQQQQAQQSQSMGIRI